MKFGRYLDENATPEWKRAYIDYRACKKQIKKISQRLANIPDPPTEGDDGEGGGGGDDGGADGSAVHRSGSSGRHGGVGGGGLSLGRRLTRTTTNRHPNQSDSESDDGDHGPARMRRTLTTAGSVRSRSSGQGGGGGSTGAPSPAGAVGATATATAGSTPPAAPVPNRSPSGIAAGFQPLRSPRGLNIVTAPGGVFTSSPTSGSLTPTTALTRTRSPGYGAMGTSPRTADAPKLDGRVRAPPPLDLGEPTLKGDDKKVDDDKTPKKSSGDADDDEDNDDDDRDDDDDDDADDDDEEVDEAHKYEREIKRAWGKEKAAGAPSHDGSSSKLDKVDRVSSLRDPKRSTRDKHKKLGVNFSPLVEAIRDHEDEPANEVAGEEVMRFPLLPPSDGEVVSDGSTVKDGSQTPLTEPQKAAADITTTPTLPSNASGLLRTASNTLPLTPSRRPKRSPSMFRFSLISPRVQPTAGVSPSDKQDAPSGAKSIRSLRLPSPRLQPRTARTMDELYDTLQPDEQAFFDLLDHELQKVETFYEARETEATNRGRDLRDQLRDLAEHRRIFHETFPNGTDEWEVAFGHLVGTAAKPKIPGIRRRKGFNESGRDTPIPGYGKIAHGDGNGDGSGNGNGKGNGNGNVTTNGDMVIHHHGSVSDEEYNAIVRRYDPERYQKYKKNLRIAMLEYYRHLELIKNYRILNLTGFRKALKKFEKVTKIVCLELYTEDRIAPCSFARGETIETLIKDTENLFTEHFEHGDGKRARTKLRQQNGESSSHYLTTFRSGIMLGLGLPPAILAIVKMFDPETRVAIPAYSALQQVYAAFYIPVVFSMLFELNLVAYVQARINYEFIMELNRPVIDYRSYFEMPAFFFMTLSYCFFFSFYPVATHSVAPTTWPLAWLVFVCVFFLDPLPILRRGPRYWFLRVLARVLTPGYSRVEFIAFFIADELNSLVYSIQGIFFMSCAYRNHWPDDVYGVCPSGRTWPYALLACIPALIRLIQCLKRFYDSNLHIHLINAGKYASSMLTACLFVAWRGAGSSHDSGLFIAWVIFATISSTYTCSWDFVVDWSLLRPGYKLLRPDLGYSQKWVYYWAMASNLVIRFIWVGYTPAALKHTHMRSWIFAFLEMGRRWQWNFFRVETEHLGNSDVYRATRDIPLPYARVDSDDDDGSATKKPAAPGRHNSLAQRFTKLRRRVVGDDMAGRGPDALNVGARGHAAQREYEARRPGDGPGRTSDDSSV